MPDEVLNGLVDVAHDEGAELFPITRPEHRLAIARLSRQADELENLDLAYWAELRAWTDGGPDRRDGVLPMTAPLGPTGANRDLLIRDFADHGLGWRHPEVTSSSDQCLMLLGTRHDSPAAWVRAGEALERVLLEITRRGYVASPLTQVIEVAATNELLCSNEHLLSALGHAQVLVRIGWPGAN